MIIAIPFAGNVPEEVAAAMIESCKRSMPDSEIWQLTDDDTQKLEDADKAIRLPMEDWGLFYLKHMCNLPETEILRLDYDVIVQRDVSPVFDLPFDLALTRRPLNDPTCSNSMRVHNPHNHGVMFLRRAKRFFHVALSTYRNAKNTDKWMDVAMAKEYAAAIPDIRWLELPGERYNYTPKRKDEDVSECSIVHYKGDRKWWMVDSSGARSAGKDVLEKVL